MASSPITLRTREAGSSMHARSISDPSSMRYARNNVLFHASKQKSPIRQINADDVRQMIITIYDKLHEAEDSANLSPFDHVYVHAQNRLIEGYKRETHKLKNLIIEVAGAKPLENCDDAYASPGTKSKATIQAQADTTLKIAGQVKATKKILRNLRANLDKLDVTEDISQIRKRQELISFYETTTELVINLITGLKSAQIDQSRLEFVLCNLRNSTDSESTFSEYTTDSSDLESMDYGEDE